MFVKAISPNALSGSLRNLARYYATKEITVSPFCNLYGKFSRKISFKPLDPFKYSNSDRLIISSDNENLLKKLRIEQTNDDVYIAEMENEFPNSSHWTVEAPVKSNFKIKATTGDINIEDFNGEFIELNCKNGDVHIAKCSVDNINILCNGNLTSKKALQASKIILETINDGSITCDRLQGLKVHLKSENGSISTKSSYCNSAIIETQRGHLNLHNLHKNCKVHIYDKGDLKITGFDGTLTATVNRGSVDVQIARVLARSKLIVQRGDINLKLAESCQNDIYINIEAAKYNIHENVKMAQHPDVTKKILILGDQNCGIEMKIKCLTNAVNVHTLSWAEMFKLSLGKESA